MQIKCSLRDPFARQDQIRKCVRTNACQRTRHDNLARSVRTVHADSDLFFAPIGHCRSLERLSPMELVKRYRIAAERIVYAEKPVLPSNTRKTAPFFRSKARRPCG